MASKEQQPSTSKQATATIPMDVAEREIPASKRKLVDPEGREIPDPKRSRALPDESLKLNAIKLILHWHEFFLKIFNIQREHIDDVADITSFLWTIHSKFRQDANGIGSMTTKITDAHQFTFKDLYLEWGKIKTVLKSTAALYGFDYGTSESSKAKTGTLGAILCLFTCYRPRFNEVRTGTSKITLRKLNNDTYEMPIEMFGLSLRHTILTTGCTYNPTLQSSMKQSLGPMTIAINLAMQTDRTYQRAWKQVFVSTFKLFPYAHEIAELLAGNKNHNNALMGVLADIALFGTTRASNKAAFPASILLTVAYLNENYAKFFSQTYPNTALVDSMIHTAVSNIDFSGSGAYGLWRAACQSHFIARKGLDMTVRTIKEAVFHAVWNSHKEDFGLLYYMTHHDFQTRREMGNQFQERGAGQEITFRLIAFHRLTKMANASQSDFIAGSKGQISRAPTFSGKCEQRVNLDDELYRVLLERQEETSGNINDPGRILARLSKVKETIAKKLQTEGIIKYGTTDFYLYDRTGQGYGEKANDLPTLTKKYFFGQDS